MRCIIVDDDNMSIQLIREYVERTDFLELVDTFENAIEATNLLMSEPIDLIFLDVEMPGMTGIEMLQSLEHKPIVILITSKEDYAVEAFEYRVADYLLKPVGYPRFLKAVSQAYDDFGKKHKVNSSNKNLYVKEDSVWVSIPVEKILWIEALGDYVNIHTPEKKHTVLTTMKAIEGKLSEDRFIRVHRSYIVQIDNIENLDGNMLVVSKKLIPIGKSYKKSLMARLNIV